MNNEEMDMERGGGMNPLDLKHNMLGGYFIGGCCICRGLKTKEGRKEGRNIHVGP